jgi:histidyl-tRNA synthetase
VRTADFSEPVCGFVTRAAAFAMITAVFERHGACTIETPVFELKETLTGKCVALSDPNFIDGFVY